MQTFDTTPRPQIFSMLHHVFGDAAMAEIFSETSTINRYRMAEAALARAQSTVGLLKPNIADAIIKACEQSNIDSVAMWAETRHVGYPIFPLLHQIIDGQSEHVGSWLHFGATTQDIMDTADSIAMVTACDHLHTLTSTLGDRLAELTSTHAATPIAGRTHALQAVPTTFGAKLAVFLGQITRLDESLHQVRQRVGVLELAGAAGTAAAIAEDVDEIRQHMAADLGLSVPTGPRHVAREHYSDFTHACSTATAICARLARELIDLGRTEVAEARTVHAPGQGASSTMPQKTNPIHCEYIIGMSSTVSALQSAMYRALEAGHERSAGEWQVEWHVLPQIAVLTAGALKLAGEALQHIDVDVDRMTTNMTLDHGLLLAEQAMFTLAAEVGRDTAHHLVSAAARTAREENIDLAEALERHRRGAGAAARSQYPNLGTAIADANLATATWKGRNK